MSIITVALDLAKNVFHIVGINAHGKEIKKCMLQCDFSGAFPHLVFTTIPPGTALLN